MKKEVLANQISVRQLEEEIFAEEGVRVIIRAPQGQLLTCGYKKVFERNLGDERELDLLFRRIRKIIGQDVQFVVINGYGLLVTNLNTPLMEIRDSYAE